MKKLVWLTVNCSYSHSSLALPEIHGACLHVPDWQWERFEVTREEDSAVLASGLAETGCDLLCAVLYLFNREKTLDILKRVHALSPGLHIAVGGPECAACSAETILAENPFVSTVFSGEGEDVFPDFLARFAGLRNKRQVIPGGRNAVYADWVHAPYPVTDPFFRTDKPFVQMETSRGCPMPCTYCTSSGVKQRYRELEQVREELTLLHEKGVREIRVLDRTFNLPQSRGAALLRLFGEFPDIRFHMEIHPQFMGDELKACFRNAKKDQFHVEAGIQSLDPAVQNAIGRRSEVPAALAGLRFLASCDAFETHTDLLSGLPGQTLASLRQDIVTLLGVNPAEIQLEVLKILPGTPILKDLEKYDIVYSPAPPYDVMRTGTMSTKEILQARKLSRILDLFYNHKALHPVLHAAAPEEFLRLADRITEEDKDLNTLLDLKKRFLYLNGFFNDEVQCVLALQWLLAGYPAAEGPGRMSETLSAIPADAEFLSGNPESRNHRESKFRTLRLKERIMYFAYNRNYSFNKPCGIWENG